MAEPLTQTQLLRFIEENEWKFASTMADNPHWYVLEKRAVDHDRFLEFVRHIKQHGRMRTFKGYRYRYIDVLSSDGEFTYWVLAGSTCGIGNTWGDIVNRKVTTEAGWDE